MAYSNVKASARAIVVVSTGSAFSPVDNAVAVPPPCVGMALSAGLKVLPVLTQKHNAEPTGNHCYLD